MNRLMSQPLPVSGRYPSALAATAGAPTPFSLSPAPYTPSIPSRISLGPSGPSGPVARPPQPISRPPQPAPRPVARPPQPAPRPVARPPQPAPRPIARPPQPAPRPIARPPQPAPRPATPGTLAPAVGPFIRPATPGTLAPAVGPFIRPATPGTLAPAVGPFIRPPAPGPVAPAPAAPTPAPAPTPAILSPQRDAHGCLLSAGYSWCPLTQSCVQPSVTPCILGPNGMPKYPQGLEPPAPIIPSNPEARIAPGGGQICDFSSPFYCTANQENAFASATSYGMGGPMGTCITAAAPFGESRCEVTTAGMCAATTEGVFGPYQTTCPTASALPSNDLNFWISPEGSQPVTMLLGQASSKS